MSKQAGFSTLCAVTALILAIPTTLFAFAGGDGTPENPYQISTREDLEAVNNDLAAHYILINDIDLAGVTYTHAIIAPDTDPGTDGFQGTPFTGTFNGNGFVISNLIVEGVEYCGLFGWLDIGGLVFNLRMENVLVTGSGSLVGGLAGSNYGSIANCYSTGTITGKGYVGGLVGLSRGSTTNCCSTGSVDGDGYLGGLVGYNFCGSITNCYSTGPVTGTGRVGGLAARNDGSISNCFSTGPVTDTGDTGYGVVGGLVGWNNPAGSITNCYSTGPVTGTGRVGGLVGDHLSGDITKCFWDTETSGIETSAGGNGKTTAEMQNINTFLIAGWDFKDEETNGTSQIWQMQAGGGYPVLSSHNGHTPLPLSGDGTVESPYLIGSAEELGAMYHYSVTACYKMTADIDLGGINWSTAVIPYFNGSFEGNGYVINNLTVDGSYHCGLFGWLDAGGAVFNLGLENVSLTGSGSLVGGLAGSNYGIIANCYSTGSVTGTGDYVGGLVGVHLSGSIANCYSTGPVMGIRNVGGLVGWNHGDVTNCYSIGSVNGTGDDVGGLVGINYKSVVNSFWDVESSGIETSDGGVGKTTAEMQDINTFLDAGWDFVTETDNGKEDIWLMADNSYPFFNWQGFAGGNGSPENPYQISTRKHLEAVNNDLSAYYTLLNDIDLESVEWVHIGQDSARFTGVFNGNGHSIYNLKISDDGTNESGLFGNIGQGGIVKDVAVLSADITCQSWAGILSGPCRGKIENCYTEGSITGLDHIGGLASWVGDGGSIENSYSKASVSGYSYIGGLCGTVKLFETPGTISNSYSTGLVTGTGSYIGGLIGFKSETESFTQNSFWNIETSGVETSAGGTGKTTVEMQDVNTFLTAGWDMASTWYMSDLSSGSSGYPVLYYQDGFRDLTVTFDSGEYGNITEGEAVQQIEFGSAAIEPTVTPVEGWIFTGWDKPFDVVMEDITITAQYEIETFTVTFDPGENGAITAGDAVQTVQYGNDAIAPEVSANPGYDFTGWDIDFTNVTGDLTVTAQYAIQNYTVVFLPGANGSITSGETVLYADYGNSVEPPVVTPVESHDFTGWYSNTLGWVSDFSSITSDMIVTAQYGIKTFTVTFEAGPQGSITSGNSVQTINYGEDAVSPSVNPLDPYNFTGWDIDYTNVTSNLTVNALYSIKTFTVTFLPGEHGQITSGETSQVIEYGSDAVVPAVEPEISYNFTGWDNSYTNITSDITITAQYSIKTFTVTFIAGENGTISGGDAVQTIEYGSDAAEPTVTPGNAWDFLGWSTDFTNVTSDLTVNALYSIKTFTVTFLPGEHGQITSGETSQVIEYGSDAVVPGVEPEIAYNFTGWDNPYTNIRSDITITAQYATKTFTVTFIAGENGTISGGDAVQTVDYGSDAIAPTVTPSIAYNFLGWDGDFTNVTSDVDIEAQYAIKTFTVTFDAGDNGLIASGEAVQVVEYGANAVEPIITPDIAYHFLGWDTDFNNVTDDLNVNALYEVKTFTVTFFAGEHGIFTTGEEQQIVDYGSSASAPAVSADNFWRFAGWDGVFENVTSDMTVTAVYRSAGDGSEDDPYRISRVSELEAVLPDAGLYYVLENDIDLEGIEYADAVIPDFQGSFNGRGHSIENMNIMAEGSNYIGLFGYLYYGSEVMNVGMDNCNITGFDGVGGLAGMNNGGIIRGCYTTGAASGNYFVGGLVGYDYASQISNCYSICDVTGGWYVGGLVGSSSSCITSYCFSAGQVSGMWMAGGLIGMKSDSDIISCFWDTAASLQLTSAGGLGLPSAQMQSSDVFVNAGWDYANESDNGNMDIWYQPAESYPLLYWQADAGDVNCDLSVDAGDLGVIADYWLLSDADMADGYRLLGDADGSGAVDMLDVSAMSGNWLAGD
jgi:hypothetical protein